MRKCRLSRLVLAATVIGAVGVLSFPVQIDRSPEETDALSSEVDWVNVDETNPWPPGSPSPTPSYDGDGESDGNGDGDGGGQDPSGGTGSGGPGEAGEPSAGAPGSADDRNESDGILGLAFPVQAGLSIGVLALAFLALLPGRKMPANLR